MPHESAAAFQQASGVRKLGPVEESDIDVCLIDSHIRERRIVDTGRRVTVVHDFAHVIAALTHHIEPVPGDAAQWVSMIMQPCGHFRIVLGSGGKTE